MRIRISRAEMIERGRRNGFLWGKSLRTGPDTHAGAWRHYCTDHQIAFITLSVGRHRAAVEFDLRTIDPSLTFSATPLLSHDVCRAIEQVSPPADDPNDLILHERGASLEVRGLTVRDGFWLAQRLTQIAGRYHRHLVGFPPNVVSLQEYRHKRASRGIA